jgi:putative membrane-bound dehydrogenase-like protein
VSHTARRRAKAEGGSDPAAASGRRSTTPGNCAESPRYSSSGVILSGVKHTTHGLAFGFVSLLLVAAPASAQDKPFEKPAKSSPQSSTKRVLVYTVSAGFEHEVSKRAKPDELSIVEKALVDLGRSSGRFEAVPSRDAAEFDPERISHYDLVFFYTTGELPLSDAQKRSLFDFVKKGGAFAGAHCATDTLYKTPEYGEMIGAYFNEHPWTQKVRVRVEDKDFLGTKHLGDSFEIDDEMYQFKDPYDRSKLHVLLSIDPTSVDLKKEAVHRTDKDFAVAWTKEFGKGRVFYTSLGHRPEVWKDERYLKLIEGGFRWAMHDEKETETPETKHSPPKKLAPEAPPGFAVDLVAEAPDVRWPSRVHCLDDGSLLVGEDPMDMPGPADKPIDRVLKLRWNDDGTYTKTVFAHDLFAVFGIEHVAEGPGDTVYVMNMPHLTKLVDKDGDGVADERVEVLTDLGQVAPGWPGGFNDHIVSGIKLWADGYLYISVGDKGIPSATGTDGKKITLRGGGVVRVRPDGTDLEIVADGLRNILSVAMDERGEMFTYDNTDDGLGWWTRFTHVILGGRYGYPWDYTRRPERTLPRMAEYGGGSPCGGLVYREAAWPAPYPGSVFFCEWGKGVLRRFELEEDGATFRVAKDEDFLRAGNVSDFRPLDVCESPDGRFLYMSDWAYGGWVDPRVVGRVWRIRRADDDPRVPSRAKPLPNDVDGLLTALGDPSFRQRMRAQQALAARGGTDSSLELLLLSSESDRSKMHALWARDAVVRGMKHVPSHTPRSRATELDAKDASVLKSASAQGDVGFRLQIARHMSLRAAPDLPTLRVLLADEDLSVRREAATAIGRFSARADVSGESDAAEERESPLLTALEANRDRYVRFAIVQALRRIGSSPYVLRLAESAQWDAIEVLRETYSLPAIDRLRDVIESSAPASLRVAAVQALADSHAKTVPWDGKWWQIQPAKQPPPAKTIEWEGTNTVEKIVRHALESSEPLVRRAAFEAVRDMPDADAAPAVRAQLERERDAGVRLLALDVLGDLRDEGAAELVARVVRADATRDDERRHAIDAACAIGSKNMIAILTSVAADDSAGEVQSVACIEALGRLKARASAGTLEARSRRGTTKVRCAAIAALAKVAGQDAEKTLGVLAQAADPEIRRAAARALGDLALPECVPMLLPLADVDATRAAATEALARTPDPRALRAYLRAFDSNDPALRGSCRSAITTVHDAVRADLEAMSQRGELSTRALDAVRAIYSEPRPILHWRILGPFRRDVDAPRIEAGPIAFEQTWRGVDAREVRWTQHDARARDGFVDLAELVSKEPNVVAFAAAECTSKTAREAEMTFGSDDMGAAWVNGELVHDFAGLRSWTENEDRFRVHLVAGANTILVRIGQATGGWSFNAEISSEGGGPLFEQGAAGPKPPSAVDDYRAFALANAGDPARGFKIFRSLSGPMCIRCHTVNGQGAQIGPDLSDVAIKYPKDDILTSILEPSKRVAEGYRAVSLALDNGTFAFGMIKHETNDEIELWDTNGDLKKIDARDVVERRVSEMSAMPEGLANMVSREEFADLVAYVMTLKNPPSTQK